MVPSSAAMARCSASSSGRRPRPWPTRPRRIAPPARSARAGCAVAVSWPWAPGMAACCWSMRACSTWSWLFRLAVRASNSARWPGTASRARGSVLASSSGGKAMGRRGLPISAASRASCASSAQRWARCVSAVVSDWTSSRRISTWPASTLVPSRTRISRTMPPSRCCMVRRVPSTLIDAGRDRGLGQRRQHRPGAEADRRRPGRPRSRTATGRGCAAPARPAARPAGRAAGRSRSRGAAAAPGARRGRP